jgi:hypothetical protein
MMPVPNEFTLTIELELRSIQPVKMAYLFL